VLRRLGPGTPAATEGARVFAEREAAAALAAVQAPAHRCPVCGFVYEDAAGHPHDGLAPGTPWSAVPDDWSCPDCGVRDKVDFVPVREAEGALGG
jgi:alkane 1-monooxygenase